MFNQNVSEYIFDFFSVFIWQLRPDGEVMFFVDFEKSHLFCHI